MGKNKESREGDTQKYIEVQLGRVLSLYPEKHGGINVIFFYRVFEYRSHEI